MTQLAKISSDDAARYYNGSILVNKDGEPVYIVEVYREVDADDDDDEHENTFVCRYKELNKAGTEWEPEREGHLPVDIFVEYMPEVGCVDLGIYSTFYTRVPRRQWTKAYTSSNITSFNPFSTELALCQMREFNKMSAAVVRQIYNPSFPSPKQIIKEIMLGVRISGAVNSDIMIGAHQFNEKYLSVYYKDMYVGRIHPNKRVFRPEKEADFLLDNIVPYLDVEGVSNYATR